MCDLTVDPQVMEATNRVIEAFLRSYPGLVSGASEPTKVFYDQQRRFTVVKAAFVCQAPERSKVNLAFKILPQGNIIADELRIMRLRGSRHDVAECRLVRGDEYFVVPAETSRSEIISLNEQSAAEREAWLEQNEPTFY